MSIFCNHHPMHYAAYSCPKCSINLCPSCIIKKKNDYYGYSKDVYLCPQCNTFVDQLSVTHAIEPFWKRLPAIFKYPLHLQPLVLMMVLALIRAFFTSINFINFIISLLCFGILLTYACLALAASANGRLTPPPIDPESISKNFNLVFKQMALYVILGIAAGAVISILNPFIGMKSTLVLGSMIILAALILLPSMIIMLAVTKSLVASIMPHGFLTLAWRIGWPYLALCLFLLMLLAAPGILGKLIWNQLPSEASYFLATLFSSYYMIVSYHLMGYVLFQYHEKVGYQIQYEGDFHTKVSTALDTGIPATADPANGLIHKINLLIRNGNYDEAISEIQNSGIAMTDPDLADRYFNLLQLREKKTELVAFAPDFIKLMNRKHQKDKLCSAYLLCSQIRPDLLEDDPETFFIVGKALLEKNEDMEAMKVFDRFVQIHQNHSMAPNAYFFIARIFNEHLKKPERAEKILQWLIKQYPFHENASFVNAYAKQIKSQATG